MLIINKKKLFIIIRFDNFINVHTLHKVYQYKVPAHSDA